MLTSPRDYFELEGFQHRALFDSAEHVWEALDRLTDYLDRYGRWEILGEVAPEAMLRGPVFIGRGTVVEPGAMIIGPAVIGENCVIRHAAYLRGYVLAGDRCVIGHCTEMKASIMLDGAAAAHFNYVGDSIIGNDVNLGAGTICANLRLDERQVRATDQWGERTWTGRRKLGAVVGDSSRTACNVVLNPGVLLPRNSTVRGDGGPGQWGASHRSSELEREPAETVPYDSSRLSRGRI
jgi:NDP-sugar pyrophosphorylase family protein